MKKLVLILLIASHTTTCDPSGLDDWVANNWRLMVGTGAACYLTWGAYSSVRSFIDQIEQFNQRLATAEHAVQHIERVITQQLAPALAHVRTHQKEAAQTLLMLAQRK